MTQHTPPNTPEDSDQNSYGPQAPSFAQDAGSGGNPYYGRQQAAPQPDLDAGSPILSSAEAQRLNRKAVLFLGAIVVLMLLLGYFVLWGREEPEEAPPPSTESEVAVPEAPTAMPELPNGLQPPEAAPTGTDAIPLEPPPPMPEEAAVAQGEAGPRQPTLMERRMLAANGSAAGAQASGGEADDPYAAQMKQMQAMQNAMLGLPPGGVAAPTVAAAPTNAQFLSNPAALLARGTYLRCVLETRIITDVPGYTSCLLTEPVYSVNGRQMLLPKGSKILGQYGEQEDGIARVAVVWDRIITPTGIDVTMSSPGVDGLGGAGHPGDYNGHWGQKIMSAMLISLISDAFQWGAAEHGPRSSTVIAGPGGSTVIDQPFESATARSIERLANQALQKSAARPGTVTINQGTVVNVYVAQDVDFSSVMAVR